MNPRSHMQPYLNNSLAIRQEIQRFESVHPSIYAIYDLIEAIPDPLIQQQIREHVVSIEDSFVNSQEWTLSRSVPDLKLGILGSINSGKSALVHRYLTGSYMQEESPEGGRFKKEVMIEGQSYLLLIRDEGGPPEMQFTHWVDAVIFVFSLENETSFSAIYNYFDKMSHYRNALEIPLILVGTQDAISESRPRAIDDSRARKMATDLKRCSYYETCATYGLNVERVFQDACQKIIQSKVNPFVTPTSRPSTPNHSTMRAYYTPQAPMPMANKPYDSHSTSSQSTSGSGNLPTATPSNSSHSIQGHSPPFKDGTGKQDKDKHKHDKKHKDGSSRFSTRDHHGAVPVACPVAPTVPYIEPPTVPPPPPDRQTSQQMWTDFRDNPTPTSTPLAARRNKKNSVHKSNSFSEKTDGFLKEFQMSHHPLTPLLNRMPRMRSSLVLQKKGEEDKFMGSGRVIPIKQGYLYKKSSKPLNKEWKKKYVTLCDDGRLTYHPSLHDYMDDVHGKEISLIKTTVKMPGGRPRGSSSTQQTQIKTNPNANGDMNNLSTSAPGFDMDGAMVIPNASLTSGPYNGWEFGTPGGSPTSKIETPNVKKRHRRAKSGTNKNIDDADLDGYEFVIVSIENKQWHFEAPSIDDREEWVCAIEQQILSSLQGNESSKHKSRPSMMTDPAAGQIIRQIKGNTSCADCDAPNPDWASLNLGALICIECSGIHRNLGTHLSRVRSLDLDEWPTELVAVMAAIGNLMVNSIWEGNTKGRTKPAPNSPREEKEKWIRGKYEAKDFLPNPPYLDVPLNQQIIDAVARQDIHNAILVLGYCEPDNVNAPYSQSDTRTALHIAAALGNVVLVQLLLWYGADVRLVDHENRNALWYARSSGSIECSEILRVQGCPENPTLPRRRASAQQQPHNNEMFEKLPSSEL